MAALSFVFLLALALTPLEAVKTQDDELQKALDRFERFERVERACVGGTVTTLNELDIVRRDCCSIPLERLALGKINEEISPCPLRTKDIKPIPGAPQPIPAEYRNCFVRSRQDGEGVASPLELDEDEGDAKDDEGFFVSNTRVFENASGEKCFCPIAQCPADPSSNPPSRPGPPPISVSMSPATPKKPQSPSKSGSG